MILGRYYAKDEFPRVFGLTELLAQDWPPDSFRWVRRKDHDHALPAELGTENQQSTDLIHNAAQILRSPLFIIWRRPRKFGIGSIGSPVLRAD